MSHPRRVWLVWAPCLVCAFALHGQPSPALAQRRAAESNDDAALIVDGVVERVFTTAGQAESLVQIEVRRADARQAPTPPGRIPVPGEMVYVHVLPANAPTRLSSAGTTLPTEQMQVRAYLIPRENGIWAAASPQWFEQAADRSPPPTSTTRNPPGTGAGAGAGSSSAGSSSNLGMTFEPHQVKDRLVLRVKGIERGGPAQQAGIESGDVIIGIGDAPLQSANQLEELARKGSPISLLVVDVNTSRPTRIELRPGAPAGATRDSESTPAPAARRSLGLTAEPVRAGLRTALKVVRVDEGSPAQKAGIEPDDILVAANGAPLTGPEQLGSALRKSGPTFTLTVRDSRTGKDVNVDVAIGGVTTQSPLPSDVSTISPATEGLGVVTELSFYDVEVALKVTEVQPGSPAARAGLQPGFLIIAANGEPVLHPNELNAAVRNSNGTLPLTVVDPRSNAKRNLQVSVGR